MNAAVITDKLGLHSLRQRHWYIQSTCATSPHARNEDLMPATTWIVECNSIYAMSIPTVDIYVAVLAGASIRDQRVCYNISSSTTCSRLKLLLSDSRMHEQYFIFTTASPLGSTTSIRCCCHPDRIEAATAPMLKSRVSTLFKHTLDSYTAIKDKEIWEGTSNPSLHYL